MDLRLVRHEAELLHQVAGKLAESIAVGVASKARAGGDAEPGVTPAKERKGVGRSVAHPVLERQVHHVAQVQVHEVGVGEVGR
jgi:hypothetical protein